MRLKLLPLVIVAALLAVTFKLGGYWQDRQALAQADQGEVAEPQQEAATQQAKAEPEEQLDSASGDRSSDAGDLAKQDQTAAERDGEGGEVEQAKESAGDQNAEPQEATPAFQKTSLSPDPFELTEEDIDLLQALAQRRETLEKRERQLDQRQALLAAAEARLDEKVVAMEQLKAEIEKLLEERQSREDEQIASLVRIYESMKPKDAARILETLELEVVLDVIGGMKERKSATVLSNMNADRAQEITMELAQRNDPPIPLE